MDGFDRTGPCLLFYVNGPAIVVGKNQNPWRECDVASLRREGIPLGRRISGGGTVYHDEGNLNYALVGPRGAYDACRVFAQVRAALGRLGIASELADGNSLVAAGRKFSGNAFCFRGNAALHHGTLLIRSDLDRLRRCLKPALPDLETRAIASKPASVVNLSELAPSLTIADVRDAIAREFAGSSVAMETDSPSAGDDLIARHASWTWTFGHTPAFTWTYETADANLTLHVEKGLVSDAEIAWCRDRVEPLPGLAGCRFESVQLAERLEGTHPDLAAALAGKL